jgi:hypothetical protein
MDNLNLLEGMEDLENDLLRDFGEEHLHTAAMIIATGMIAPHETIVVQKAMCIVLAVYGEKIKSGEISDRVLH